MAIGYSGKYMADTEYQGITQGASHQDEAARLEAALARIQAACSGRSAPVPAFLGERHQSAAGAPVGASVPNDLAARLDGLIAEIRGLLAQGL